MKRTQVWSGSPWEERAGYCRAVRMGPHIWVAGTAPFTPEGGIAHPGDLAGQTARCIEIIAEALSQLGASLSDVVATRMYVTDINGAGDLSGPHRQAFGANPPVATLVEVAALVHPDVLIEMEAEAMVSDE